MRSDPKEGGGNGNLELFAPGIVARRLAGVLMIAFWQGAGTIGTTLVVERLHGSLG